MATIIAQGTRYGRDVVVTIEGEDGNYKMEVEPEHLRDVIIRDFERELKEGHSMGGTYYPEEKSLLNAYNVLYLHFFEERTAKVIVKGDIGTIPPVPPGAIA